MKNLLNKTLSLLLLLSFFGAGSAFGYDTIKKSQMPLDIKLNLDEQLNIAEKAVKEMFKSQWGKQENDKKAVKHIYIIQVVKVTQLL